MKEPGKTSEAIRYWWDKAEESLESAKREFIEASGFQSDTNG